MLLLHPSEWSVTVCLRDRDGLEIYTTTENVLPGWGHGGERLSFLLNLRLAVTSQCGRAPASIEPEKPRACKVLRFLQSRWARVPRVPSIWCRKKPPARAVADKPSSRSQNRVLMRPGRLIVRGYGQRRRRRCCASSPCSPSSRLPSSCFDSREILILRRLDHPNVIKLEGLLTSRMSCSLYLVLEYMEHVLAGLASFPRVKFTEPQVKCYMQQLLLGLEHCHSRHILHRDIKGSNLLIDNRGVLKIADFGLFFTTKPYACNPSSLPRYPSSKEFDAKRREEEALRQGGFALKAWRSRLSRGRL